MWRSIRVAVLEGLISTDPSTLYHVVGYSLGGALAILAAEELRRFDHLVVLTTFGAPQVFWGPIRSALRHRLAGIHYRVRGDIVPAVPFRMMGYSTGGRDVKIGPMSIIKIDNHSPETYKKYLSE
jgi:alpha-beta hydrolase superfamily lysophospholipase